MAGYVIGVDLGTSALKAVAADGEGRTVARTAAGYATHSPRPGWAEQDPAAWIRAARDALGELLTQAAAALGSRARPAALGLSGQMHGIVLVDRAGTPLRPAVLWADSRCTGEVAELAAGLGGETYAGVLANPPSTGFSAPKVLWHRRAEPRLFSRAASVLLPKDYLRLWLTGERATDVSDASGTLLLDVPRRRWAEQVLEALELPAALLPPVYESGEVTGRVTQGAAAATGLPEGLPVAAGAGDAIAAVLGNGLVEPGPLSVNLGSAGQVVAVLARPLTDPALRVHTLCHAVPGRWVAMGAIQSAGLALQWALSLVGSSLQQAGPVLRQAATVAPGAEGLVFLPYLAGERSPHMDAGARGVLAGLALHHGPAHVVRSVMEGVALALDECAQIVGGLAGRPAPCALASGGGARSPLWCQILADVLGLPVYRSAVQEASARGAALLAGMAAGMWTPADLPGPGGSGDGFSPRPGFARDYQVLRAVYRSLYGPLKGAMHRLAALAPQGAGSLQGGERSQR